VSNAASSAQWMMVLVSIPLHSDSAGHPNALQNAYCITVHFKFMIDGSQRPGEHEGPGAKGHGKRWIEMSSRYAANAASAYYW
jgi:hypothetical protein